MDWCKKNGYNPSNPYVWDWAERAYIESLKNSEQKTDFSTTKKE